MSEHTQADRTPATPQGAFDLQAAADDLLDEARGADDAGRAARTLTPGEGAPLKQTLMALLAGRELSDHRSPGPATLVALRGRATLTWNQQELEVPEGHWAAIPAAVHGLRADTDLVLLLTVAKD